MQDAAPLTTFLFTDIEGSTRLWEQAPERMRPALAHHDAVARSAVEEHRGHVVKMTGDGVHAVFDDPLDAIRATLEMQQALAGCEATHGVALRVRCGLHGGAYERRDNDFYGAVVNRAARIMGAAHGGQMLVSQAVAERLGGRLPEGVALRDLGLVRLRDLSHPERLYQLVHPELRGDFPALRTLEGTPNNLPHALSSFVGREREIAAVRELLAQHRLVTVAGMGGLGKTRLALQAAAEVMDEYPDGVWLAELAPFADARRIVQAIASTLGVVEEVGRPLDEALVRHVKERVLLIILDNCEHLLEAAAAVAKQLLSAAAGVRILATSREVLRMAGEAALPLAPLPVPGPRVAVEPSAVLQYDAARLFVERAIAARPDFAVNEENALALSAICHRLDGVPLAIELAAARVRTLPVQQIAARLKDRFRLLTAGDPTALPRQRTMRATIDWSYELLPDGERALFRQLAAFASGWTLEAAEAVCDGAASPDESVLDLLGRLAEKSLVAIDAETNRYRLLETVRQYAQERLAESGEASDVRNRHLGHFVAFAESARAHLVGPDQAEWLARLDLERENILSAHEWAGQAPDAAEIGHRLSRAVKFYWINRGLFELGHRVTAEALARMRPPGRDLQRMRGLFDLGQLLNCMGRYGEARRTLEESLAIARALGEPKAVAAVLTPLSLAAVGDGDAAGARAYVREAHGLARVRGDKRELMAAINAVGQLDLFEGKPGEAAPQFREVVAIARELGDGESLSIGLLNLAMVSIGRDPSAKAVAMALEALSLANELRSRRAAKTAFEVCAGLAASLGDWASATRFFGCAEAQAIKTLLRRDPADEAFLGPWMAKAHAALGPERFGELEAAGRALDPEAAAQQARHWLEERAPRAAA